MPLPLFIVDAFTDRPFAGNPAAVCLLSEPKEDAWLQNVAREMTLSETAFIWSEGGDFRLRWFTPIVEVDLCGHATLAAAHILWQTRTLAPGTQARFHTHSGLLTADQRDNWIELNFPAEPPQASPSPRELTESLGAVPVYAGQNRMDYLIEVESETVLRSLTPDFARLAQIPVRGVIVTSRSDSKEFDFVSRFFAPSAGVPEDPVTGSAHCCLGPYWADKLNKNTLTAFQASKRGGVIRVQTDGNRVHISGQSVTVVKGEWVG